MACCVLHNICLMRNDMIDIPIVVINPVRYRDENDEINRILNEEGRERRENITNTLNIALSH